MTAYPIPQEFQRIFDRIDTAGVWSSGRFRCSLCRRVFKGERFEAPSGGICTQCVEVVSKEVALAADLTSWSSEQLVAALDTSSVEVRLRLVVLWRCIEILRYAEGKSPSDAERIRQLLVANLGYIGGHPLAPQVRQAALQACTWVGESMVPLLISMCGPKPWQLFANIALALVFIAPENPEARALIERAAQDPNPEIHNRIRAILLMLKKKRLQRSGTTSVLGTPPGKVPYQKGIFDIAGEVGPQERPSRSISIETPAERKIADLIDRIFPANQLKQIYACFLHGRIFDERNFAINGPFSPHKLTKPDLVRVVAKVYANKDLFVTFFGILPKDVQAVLQYLVWEAGETEAETLERMFSTAIMSRASVRGYRSLRIRKDISEDYSIFLIRHQSSWEGRFGRRYTYYLSLPDELRRTFKQHLPQPDGYHFTPLDSIKKTGFTYANQDHILRRIKVYCTFVTQENPQCSRNTGKLLKWWLKRMADYCHIEEFYPDTKDKGLEQCATILIINFLRGAECGIDAAPPQVLKQLFSDFFSGGRTEGFELLRLLPHVKGGLGEHHRHEKWQARVKKSLLGILKDMPPSKWVSFENIRRYCLYREIDLDILTQQIYRNDLYFTRKGEEDHYPYSERIYIREGRYLMDAITIPLLKGMMFLFAAFGLVDIAYDPPMNQELCGGEGRYLTPYDGLRYVRLTPLGEYVIGKAARCPVATEEETARILLDDQRLIMTIEGKDPLKAMLAARMGERISENCYRVTYRSFLKECATEEGIKKKVALFRTRIARTPPPVWEAFLNEVLARINPLSKREGVSVFRLKQDKGLISLIAGDEVLRQCVLKAEDYHILIATHDIPKAKKRLEEFGYFIDNM